MPVLSTSLKGLVKKYSKDSLKNIFIYCDFISAFKLFIIYICIYDFVTDAALDGATTILIIQLLQLNDQDH